MIAWRRTNRRRAGDWTAGELFTLVVYLLSIASFIWLVLSVGGCATAPARADPPCHLVSDRVSRDGCDVYRCGESQWDPRDWNATFLLACTPEAIERARRAAEESTSTSMARARRLLTAAPFSWTALCPGGPVVEDDQGGSSWYWCRLAPSFRRLP